MIWFWFWLHRSVSTHWIGSQPSVKRLGWGSAPPNLRPWFSAGNRWTVHSKQGMSPYPKWRSSSISGSCSRVREQWRVRWARESEQRERYCSRWDKVRSSVIREGLGVEPLLLCVERNQLRWFGHLVRMPPGRLPREVFQARLAGRRPRGRPRTRWRDYVF